MRTHDEETKDYFAHTDVRVRLAYRGTLTRKASAAALAVYTLSRHPPQVWVLPASSPVWAQVAPSKRTF